MEEKDNKYFDHEKLKVYQLALKFNKYAYEICSKLPRSDVRDQLERASNSIVLNIAEGNGKYTPKDRCRYFDISYGSSLESAACIDILNNRDLITINESNSGKLMLKEIVSMLIGLIKSNSDRVYNDGEDYNA
ncbi:Ribosomal protein S23 [Ignavibacterium album JCM 16511]|uniref:Ribosomal protein S23 n=1 Tax=Ignavibacterium album (strain DSM 19864 / JCM 16511 / NBRC 101810 / Mat9-16) TaxID=945713 RepID=I0ANX6_IGNAJ|nr:four helix bundle protein [Ignavibacterium album]AFH50683.1 Ribosomal protein S23 [Ignavibacterium album JCM 16511]